MFQALWHEHDSICAIVGTSHLEHSLRALLRKYLIDGSTAQSLLDPAKGALGQLHNAASVAYCLGLISKDCKANIETIGLIRNLFAHSIDDVTFSDPKITALCNELTVPPNVSPEDPNPEPEVDTPRKKFGAVLSLTSMFLMATALHSVKPRAAPKLYVGLGE